MKIRQIFIISLIVLICNSHVYAELTTSQIAKKYSLSVVTIVALDENDQPLGLGSGFFINENGDIATNHHVLEGSSKAILKTANGDKGTILEILKDDPDLDLLIAKTSLKNTNPLPFGDSDTITVGEDIVAIGNPAGLQGTVSKGIISGIRKVDDYKFIQITASISPGSSGGPVFNLSGKVIGVATAYLDYGQSLNFAMPINYIKTLKTKRLKLRSLPKSKSKNVSKDKSLVKIVDLHYEQCAFNKSLCDLTFSIKNNSTYTIRNVQIFFIYKRLSGEIISYSSKIWNDPILPSLASQFTHSNDVKYFFTSKYETKARRDGEVEIRILDYDIDRESISSPADLLFK